MTGSDKKDPDPRTDLKYWLSFTPTTGIPKTGGEQARTTPFPNLEAGKQAWVGEVKPYHIPTPTQPRGERIGTDYTTWSNLGRNLRGEIFECGLLFKLLSDKGLCVKAIGVKSWDHRLGQITSLFGSQDTLKRHG